MSEQKRPYHLCPRCGQAVVPVLNEDAHERDGQWFCDDACLADWLYAESRRGS